MYKPEIMSPAGYWPQLHAAVEAGADAVYFGLKHFTARAKVGFGLDELPAVMHTLHARGVRGYVTFNTLLFNHELPEAARTLAAIAKAGADAIIVQDPAAAALARRIAPELEIHGSTQMSITSAEGVELARQWGATRVVLARELSLDDIRAIRASTDCELEMFVHGALCVSYSGQCFSSEAWGGRSANRGQCAQACRLPYELEVDGVQQPLGAARYLLSPGDLYALREMPAIARLGVSSLKIEGRYKDAEYVALTTQAYRQVLDEAWDGLPLSLTQRDELHVQQVYSRGSGPFFVSGTNHQEVVDGRAPRHRGVFAGRVEQLDADRILVALDPALAAAPLKAGDGMVFDAADWRSPEEREEGGRIYQVQPLGANRCVLRFAQGALDLRRIRPGDWLWRTSDAEIARLARPFTEASTPVQRQPLRVTGTAREGEPLVLHWQLLRQPELTVTLRSPEPLPLSRHSPLTPEFASTQLGRLGNTPYALAELELEIAGAPFAPSSLLNTLRRQAVEALAALQTQPLQRTLAAPAEVLEALLPAATAPAPSTAPCLHVLVRTPEQLAAAIAAQPASITLDYLELYGLRPAVEQVQAAGIEARVASPRILKPTEQRVIRFLLKLNCPILVRSGGLLHALQAEAHPPLVGDFSLNVANSITAITLLDAGLERITPTHDLNAAQVAELAQTLGGERIEAIVYQHLPVFHTEHCVFCRFLSSGTSFKDCGHPCETHRVALRDVNGRAHPVMADVGCRNTVFGAEAQTASLHLQAWLHAGIRHLRVEFVHETAAQVTGVLAAFGAAVAGPLDAAALQQALELAAPQGLTQGSLFVPDEYLRVPLLA